MPRYTRWLRQLLAVSDGDPGLARRQLAWLMGKVHSDTQRLSERRVLLDRYVRDCVHRHKPIQYILGTQPFGDLDIVTKPPTLIPRWETEEWVHRLVTLLEKETQKDPSIPLSILDICTGTGCIALTLAAHLKNARILATDVSQAAVALAKHNKDIHASELKGTVEFKLLDVFDDIMKQTGPFDVIVCNPPYITPKEYMELDPNVKEWEDKKALVADQEGTAVHRRIIELSRVLLRRDSSRLTDTPRLLMEIGGTHQVSPLWQLLQESGFEHIEIWKDLAGKDRVIAAK